MQAVASDLKKKARLPSSQALLLARILRQRDRNFDEPEAPDRQGHTISSGNWVVGSHL
jgi:hypothetical protein